MPRKWNLLVLLFVSTSALHAQPLSKKEWKSALKAYYQQYQKLTAAKRYVYQEVLFERETFFVEVPASEVIAQTRALAAKTAKITLIEEDMGPQLSFEANISDAYPAFISDQIDIALFEANLQDAKGQAIELASMYQSGADGNTILHRVGIAGDQSPQPNKITGTATYDLSFLLRYDQVKLAKENTGESFSLAGCEFTLIEVLHNQIILESSCDHYLDLKLINWSEEGHIFSPYLYDELMAMAAKDPSIDTDGAFSQSSSSVPKKIFQLLKEQPNFTLKKLRKAFPIGTFSQQVMDGDQYLVLSNVAPITGNFTLFAPVYETDRVVVEYKKGK